MIAALYIDPRGPYPKLPGVECWDEKRDARLYAGPWPVVAHPPCGPWSRLKHFYRGNEHDCAPAAIAAARTWGGVVEHPAHSTLWAALALPEPCEFTDAFGGFTIEVDQCAWGHVARKATWLYCVGIDLAATLAGVRTGGHPTHYMAAFWEANGRRKTLAERTGRRIPEGLKLASAQRRRTPPAFAEWLVAITRSVTRDQAELALDDPPLTDREVR